MGGNVDTSRPQDWKTFKGTIEITIEVKSQKEANDFFSKRCTEIIHNNHNVYKIKSTTPEES